MIFDVEKISSFPQESGVYIMRDQSKKVIYVGKAKNLRKRVKQYFLSSGDSRPQVPFLILKVRFIETIVVSSEKEALLLENTLIEKYKPQYNIFFKDDRSYVYIQITNHVWPRICLKRHRDNLNKDRCFGPYISIVSARHTFDMLKKIFPLRQCSDMEFITRKRPCLLFQMGRCVAPCVGRCSQKEYENLVNSVIQFLKGNDKKLIKELYNNMQKASDQLDFERALDILQTINSIEKTIEKQSVYSIDGGDEDLLAVYRQGDEVGVTKMMIREGKLCGAKNYFFSEVIQDDADILRSFILQHYYHDAPKKILISSQIENAPILSEIISENKKHKISILCPVRGNNKTRIDMAYNNARTSFHKEKDEQSLRKQCLLQMKEVLKLVNYPECIECFDVSHISGSCSVAAMVVFMQGVPNKSQYRKFHIKTVSVPDDYAAMKEVLLRRYSRKEKERPSLLIVDGGKGQLNIALEVLKSLHISDMDVIGLAKDEGRHDKGVTSEKIFIPLSKDPIILDSNSKLLFMLQQIRDESHRFAIEFHWQQRSKNMTVSILEKIPGIGPAKKKALLKYFGSTKKIRQASQEELAKVNRLSHTDIKAIIQFFLSN